MKTLFRVLALGMLLTMLGAVSTFAQDDPESLEALFNKFKVERRQPCGKRDAALATGKKILEKYASDPDNQEVIKYVREQVALFEKEDPVCKRNDAYNAAYKAKDWAKFISISKEIIAAEGDTETGLDVALTLVSVGYDRSVIDKNDAYAGDTLNYAKSALQKLNSGKTTKQLGVYLPFKTKENAVSWMNYIIGYYTNKSAGTDAAKKKEALSYFFKSTQAASDPIIKGDHLIFTNIGDFYFNEAAKLDEEYRTIRAANNNTETDEAKAKLLLARGYADRAIDAFGRARQVATTNNKKTVADAITKKLGELYRFRFNIAATAPTPDLEKYVSGFLAKPMPDPSTEVTPVAEEVAPTTTTTSTTTTSPATTTTSTTKAPATTPATNATTTTKTTTPAKKPVTKKKGTR